MSIKRWGRGHFRELQLTQRILRGERMLELISSCYGILNRLCSASLQSHCASSSFGRDGIRGIVIKIILSF